MTPAHTPRRCAPSSRRAAACSLVLMVLLACFLAPAAPRPQPPEEGEDPSARSVEALRAEAARLLPHIRQPGAQRYLIATSYLPLHGDRQVWVERDGPRILAPEAHEALPEAQRSGFTPRTIDEHEYYYLGGVSPHAAARAIDIACEHLGAGWDPLSGKRILVIEPTSIATPRLLASIGGDVVAVTSDPLFRTLYEPTGDTGVVPGIPAGGEARMPDGRLTIVEGTWCPGGDGSPAGAAFDLILLVQGLPGQRAARPGERTRDVNQEVLAASAFRVLRPGGAWVTYTVRAGEGDAPPVQPSREALEKAGFEILAYDREDDEMIRHVGRALRWDKGTRALNLDAELFAAYTVARRPVAMPKTGARPVSP
jgi:hypothetical protein